MDFLKIRKKAKERASAKASSAPDPASPPAGAAPAAPEVPGGREPADALPAPPPDPVITEVDVIEGELAARLQGLPAADERFTTWRPGTGNPPEVPPPSPGVEVRLRDEDFALVLRGARPAERRGAGPGARADATDPLDEFFYRPGESSDHLPALGAPAVEPAAAPGPVALDEYLTFLLGQEEYAVSIRSVREVLRAPPVTEVPRAPPDVLGVVTVRGDVVPVFDPRRRLGLPPAASSPESGRTRIVIVDAGEGPCGLLVDAVAGVARVRPGSVEPCPQGIATASAESIEGIGRAGERLFMVLDLGVLLRRAAPGPGGDEERPDAGP